MFKGNKLVVLLPLILMFFLFIGGGFYINQAEKVSNKDLSEEVEWETTLESGENGDLLKASWQWGRMPSDGLRGTDYIGVTFLDRNGEPVTESQVENASLLLDQNSGDTMKIEPEAAANGIRFAVPNEMNENETIGSSGTVQVRTHSNLQGGRAVISYLHTWEEHGGIAAKNARFFEPSFHGKEDNNDSFYWVMEHFVEHNSGAVEEESG
ncbi:hypothetical protein [Salibacterium sp. K-3]